MKESAFLKSAKGRIIIIAAAAVLAAATVVTVLLLTGGETGYRNISVSKIYGSVMTESGGNEYKAYENMRLADGYVLTTGTDSYARLVMDGDKYVKIEEESRAVFTNVGNANSHITAITVESGTITAEVVNPLTEEESFVVTTPNAVLAVRGTMFKVGVSQDETGKAVTEAYTFGGTVSCRLVQPDGTVSDEEIMITQGSKSCIESNGSTVGFSGDAVVPITINDISDEDIVDIYNASSHGHAMFLETAELWQEIADRNIDLSEYDSVYDSGEVAPYIEADGTTSGSDAAEASGSQSEKISEAASEATSEATTTADVPETAPVPEETTVTVPEAVTEPEVIASVTTTAVVTSSVSSTTAASPEVTPKPEETKPTVTAPQTTTNEKTKPEVTKTEETKPEVTKTEETKPEVTKPEETKPETTKPEETKPEVTKPEETEPEVTKPEEPPLRDALYVENGSITITETGYVQGDGKEVAYTGDYVIRQKNPDATVEGFYITVESGIHNITVEGLNICGNRDFGVFHVAYGAGITLNCKAENTISSDYSALQNFGLFEISSGSLNISSSLGILNNGNFVISGGTLTLDCCDLGINNYADYYYGGAVGAFLISGGTVTAGTISNSGGWFTVSGGRITADAIYNYGGWFTIMGGSITAETITAEGFTYAFMTVTGGSLRVTGETPCSIIDIDSRELECVAYDAYPGNLLVTLADREYRYALSAEDAAADGKYYVWVPVERVSVTEVNVPEEEPDRKAVENPDPDVDGYLPEEELGIAAHPETEKKLPV